MITVMSKKYRVVIAGGGYGGVKTALELAGRPNIDVTLITDYPSMRIYPSLYHTATGGSKKVSDIPLSEIIGNKRCKIIIDSVTKLDRQDNQIITKSSGAFPYNALVLSLGVKTNYFNIKGLEEYSFGIKTLEEAEELKKHLHEQLVESGRQDTSYVVVGGGPTGVELAGMLPSYIKEIARCHDLPERKVHVDLIEAAPRILPRSPKSVSRAVARNLRKQGVKIYTKTAVQAQTADALMVHGKPIRSHTVVWTAGTANSPFFEDNNFQLSANKKVRVDQFLQAERGIYVLGDNADTPYSGMAQTALHDGKFVSSNIIRLSKSLDPIPYRAKKPIYVMPAGPRWAAVMWGRFRIYGRVGWMIRRAADYIAYKDYESFQGATLRFLAENDREEYCPVCIDDLALQR